MCETDETSCVSYVLDKDDDLMLLFYCSLHAFSFTAHNHIPWYIGIAMKIEHATNYQRGTLGHFIFKYTADYSKWTRLLVRNVILLANSFPNYYFFFVS